MTIGYCVIIIRENSEKIVLKWITLPGVSHQQYTCTLVNRDDVTAAVGALAGAALGYARKLVPVRSSARAGGELVEHEEDDDVAADPDKDKDEIGLNGPKI